MELRHLRYFVAAAEERGFARASQRLRVAQPALSRQIHDLEAEVGVALFQRLPRGVRLTAAGEAFLVEARITLERAERAIDSARGAAERRSSSLRLAHGDLYTYDTIVQALLAAFREANPDGQLEVSSQSSGETLAAVREQRADVGCVFVAQWPVKGFESYRLLDTSATGVLLPASHPVAAKREVRLADLRTLRWMGLPPGRRDLAEAFETAFRDRGLVTQRADERAFGKPSPFVQIAVDNVWALSNEAVGAPYRTGSTAVVYRPFVDPPIPSWLALVWLPPPAPMVHRLVDVARRMRLSVSNDQAPERDNL